VIGHTVTALSPSDVSVWDTLKITFFKYYFLTLSYISAVTSHKQLTGYFIVHTFILFVLVVGDYGTGDIVSSRLKVTIEH